MTSAHSTCAASLRAIPAIATILAGIAGSGANASCAERGGCGNSDDRKCQEECFHVRHFERIWRIEQEFLARGHYKFVTKVRLFFLTLSVVFCDNPSVKGESPMKRLPLLLFLSVFVFSATLDAQQSRRKSSRPKAATPKSAANIQSITDCPLEGVGGDPNLNRRKNIQSDKKTATLRSIQWMKTRGNPPKEDCKLEDPTRKTLRQLGEGQKITVVAWALAARAGGKESCNCGLTSAANTDNHIVLVDLSSTNPTLKSDEDESETAEFTPRTRLDHPNFTQNKLQSLIDPQWKPGERPRKGKLLVRVTGLLMFDSEHYCRRALSRFNNWEIHPVLKLEYCPPGKTCGAKSNTNWKNLDK